MLIIQDDQNVDDDVVWRIAAAKSASTERTIEEVLKYVKPSVQSGTSVLSKLSTKLFNCHPSLSQR